MKDGTVEYEVLREYRDKYGVRQDIAVRGVWTRELLDRLARQLTKEFADRLTVVVNVFEAREMSSNHRHGRTKGDKTAKREACLMRYMRSRDIGLHQMIVYPGHPPLASQVIRLS